MKFIISGMSCAACSARIENVISALEGILSCEVNLLTGTMTVQFKDNSSLSSDSIIKEVEKIGYGAKLFVETEKISPLPTSTLPSLIKRLFFSLALLTLILLAPLLHFYTKLLQALLSLAIMIINRKYFTSGLKSLIHRAPNMDTLVALGSIASYIYGSFDGAGMILSLITVGKTLEAYAKGKTTNALNSLIKLSPETAVVLRGKEMEIPVEQIVTGDIFIVRPGSNIPVDGVVIEGNAAVDESSITGESIPSDKKCGSTVTSGTTNLNGILKCRALKVGKDTTLSQIIQIVSDSVASKAPVQRIADKVSAIFVPTVILIAVFTTLIWLIIGQNFEFSLMRGISVLVISCPCALGLATPVAIMVGNGIGAKKGILFKNSIALEHTGKAKTIILDKTGTLTKGKPVVTQAIKIDETEDFIAIALELEKNSNHPIAKAICSYAENKVHKHYLFSDFREIAGSGVQAVEKESGNVYFCGKNANSNLICVTKNGRTIGKFKIQDELKEDSVRAVEELHNLGLNVVLLTGDNETNATETGKLAGVDKIIAGVLPQQKAEKVAEYKKDGFVVMVGDGINDAPALSVADVGVAVGGGSDIAIDSADIVLVKDRICDVAQAIKISRKVLKNIKENLFWAFFYNVCGIPIAAGCFIALGIELTPVICSACMSLSSFCVVSNALRLNNL